MRTKKGVVVSTKMDKTLVVEVTSYKADPKYKKRFKITKKFYAHSENDTVKEGDVVLIKESKPISKLKRWVLAES